MDYIQHAHNLHQIPEVGNQEFKTTQYLMEALKDMGYQPKQLLSTGCYVFIDKGKDKTIAFRSDIDALPTQEESCHPTPSLHEGYMHACGHDGHMAILLGFAKEIKNKDLNYNILLIFQPAEEQPGGAKSYIEKGLFHLHPCSAIFGLHLNPSLDKHQLGIKAGPLMAMCGALDITITGKSAHAGLPHEGLDTMLVATYLVQMYNTIITKQLKPTETALIHIGQMLSGDARNIVSDKTELHGTIRTYSEETFHFLVSKMNKINQGLESMYDVSITLSCPPMYPPVLNDTNLTSQLLNIFKVDPLEEAVMLSEDFSFYQKEMPGVFLFLGTKTEKYNEPLHSSRFYFEEDVLQTGIDAFIKIIQEIEV